MTNMKIKPQFQETMQRAENLAKQGAAAYGSQADFNLEEDMAGLEQAGIMAPGQAQTVVAAMSAPSPVAPVVPVAPPVQMEAPVQSPATEEQPKEEGLSQDPAKRLDQVHKILSEQFSACPSKADLQQWKSIHGNIFFLQLDNEVFIYRYLKRQEWVQLNADPVWAKLNQDQKNEKLFIRCVLFPAFGPLDLLGREAGLIDAVVGQIEMQSMFVDPYALAANSTIKL